MNRFVLVTFTFAALWAASAASGEDKSIADQQKIYEKIDRALVTVEYNAKMTFMGQSEDIEGRVMGIYTGPDGMIIFDGATLGTGLGIGDESFGSPRVEKPRTLKVIDYRDREFEAEFIGVDQYSSIAFGRLPDSVRDEIETADFGKTDLKLGEEVFVFWMLPENYRPRFQMARTIITGILDKPEKHFLTGELTQDFIMAPVVTKEGRLAGIITPVAHSGGSYSRYDYGTIFGNPVGIMPHDRFIELLAKPPAPGEFKRGWLGIALQALDPEIAEFWGIDVSGGIIVSDVIPYTPAEKAGLKKGDFLVELDGEPLDIKKDANLTVFQKMISERGTGSELNVTVIRPEDEKAETLYVSITLGETPIAPGDAPTYEDKNFDLTVRDMVFSDYNADNLDPDEIKGVIVDRLEPGGWAAVGGLRPGDIITTINGGAVSSADESRGIFTEIEKGKKREVVFMVWRNHRTQFVNVKTHWK